MRVKTVFATLLMGSLGLGLSACYYPPGPDYAYYNQGYYGAPYDQGYYGAPAYYGPAYYGPAYYGPSVGFYYGGRSGGGWDHDRRWR
jgi:hypothetical protein